MLSSLPLYALITSSNFGVIIFTFVINAKGKEGRE